MIVIAGSGLPAQWEPDISYWPFLERHIFERKRSSTVAYYYATEQQVRFEMQLRARIVDAAQAFDLSKAEFAPFAKSRCNAAFWERMPDGGFRLQAGSEPAAAIRDIFASGHLYAFECATAVVVVLYKGVLDVIGDEAFNRHFAALYLYDWQYDSDLRLVREQPAKETYPGDVLYFKNPEVSPETPEWQGENAVKLEDDRYFAHGIGIVSAAQIIAKLNRHRRPGSTQPAYLLDEVFYPDFHYLAGLAPGGIAVPQPVVRAHGRSFPAVYARIGHIGRTVRFRRSFPNR